MSYHLYKTDGIVLASYPRGEADKAFFLYTRDFGAQTLFAQGVRHEKSKLRGALNLFSHAAVAFVMGRERRRLTYADVIAQPTLAEKDTARYRALARLAWFVRAVIDEGEADARMWQILYDAHRAIMDPSHPPDTLDALWEQFQLKALDTLGYIDTDAYDMSLDARAARERIRRAYSYAISSVPPAYI